MHTKAVLKQEIIISLVKKHRYNALIIVFVNVLVYKAEQISIEFKKSFSLKMQKSASLSTAQVNNIKSSNFIIMITN